eukprot:632282-Amphidinium_carterae.3
MAVSSQKQQMVHIVADSGSGEHCCPKWFAPGVETEACSGGVLLRDVQGRRIGDHGQKLVPLLIGQPDERKAIAVTFIVAAVEYPVISLGKLRKQGFGVVFPAGGDSGVLRHSSGLELPLKVKGDQWVLEASVLPPASEKQCAGVSVAAMDAEEAWQHPEEQMEIEESGKWQAVPMEYRAAIHGPLPEGPPEVLAHEGAAEELEAPLRFSATRDQMRTRLRQYGSSASGTKAELWARLTKLEYARRKERQQAELLHSRGEDIRQGRAEYAPLLLPAPDAPTEDERLYHMLTHLPPKRWCEFCTQGRGRDDPHWRTGHTAAREVPAVEMDFMFLDAAGIAVEQRERAAYITLVGYDAGSGYPTAVAVTSKTPSKYLSSSMAHFLQRLHGAQEVTLRTDGEPAITKLAEEVVALRVQRLGDKVKTHVEGVPRYSSSSKGGVENACKLLQGIIRTMRFALEALYKTPVTPEKPIWPFLVRHAAFIAARFHVKPTGVTPFKAAFGEQYNEPLRMRH